MKSRMLGAVSACVFTFTSITTAQAVPVSGQGTWETTLEGRLETAPGSGVFLAYYDTVLDITWLADANAGAGSEVFDDGGDPTDGRMTWDNARAWAADLTIGGVSGWRLPTVSPIDGNTFDTTHSNNATTDWGSAPTTTDGTDGGWRDAGNTPVSELGHMYYVTLGNLGICTPDDADPSSCVTQPGSGPSNTGPFSGVPGSYWSGKEFNFGLAWHFGFPTGTQTVDGKNDDDDLAWAVRSGDVPAFVPVPAAVWLFGSGLIGLIGIARRKRAA